MAQDNKDKAAPGSVRAIDVIAPGKTAPPPSGKPIIVTNRPMIKDPMAPPPLPSSAPAVDRANVPSRVAKAVIPMTEEPRDEPRYVPAVRQPSLAGGAASSVEPPKDVAPIAPSASQPEVKPEPKEVAPPAVSKGDVAPKNDDEPADSGADSDQANLPATDAKSSSSDAAAKEAAAKADAERMAEQERIIGSKQYYLPISPAGRKHRGVYWFLLWSVFVVAVAAAAIVWIDIIYDLRLPELDSLPFPW